MDKFLTKDKVSVIIQNAPTGVTPEEVINGLVSRGYILQGFNDQEPQQAQDSGLFSRGRAGAESVKSMSDPTKVINAFPGGKVGESIGTLAGLGITKAKEAVGLVPKGTTAQYDISSPSPLQVAGDVAQGALTIGGIKAPMPATAGARIAQTAGFGAGLSGSEAISEGKKAKEVIKDTAKGAVTGAVLQSAFEGVPVLGEWLGKKADNLRKSSLRLSPQDKLNFNNKIDDVVGYLKQENITGNPEKQYSEIVKRYNNAETTVGNTLKQSGKTYTRQELVDDVMRIPEKYAGEFDNPEVYDQLTKKSERLADYIKNTFGQKYGDAIPAEKLNELKRQYAKNAFNKAGDAVTNEANMTISDELYSKVLADVPELQSINSVYSNIITARKILGKALGRNELGSFGNLVALGAGAGIGSIVGGPAGAVVGTVTARPIARAVAGTAARTQYAKGAEKVGKALQKTKGTKAPRIVTKLLD